jgi:hypothetical protein
MFSDVLTAKDKPLAFEKKVTRRAVAFGRWSITEKGGSVVVPRLQSRFNPALSRFPLELTLDTLHSDDNYKNSLFKLAMFLMILLCDLGITREAELDFLNPGFLEYRPRKDQVCLRVKERVSWILSTCVERLLITDEGLSVGLCGFCDVGRSDRGVVELAVVGDFGRSTTGTGTVSGRSIRSGSLRIACCLVKPYLVQLSRVLPEVRGMLPSVPEPSKLAIYKGDGPSVVPILQKSIKSCENLVSEILTDFAFADRFKGF